MICDDCGEKAFSCDCLESTYSPVRVAPRKNRRLFITAIVLEVLGVALFCAIWVILWMGTGD